jgi:tRNA (cmo5U34)-methyltransferase
MEGRRNYQEHKRTGMAERSIDAYDVLQRVESYDADMELMHPNRSKMVQVALELLPFTKTAALRAIDLGIGTGYFTERFLNQFPNSRVLGIDGARAMLELAKARLRPSASRVQFVIGDFRNLQHLASGAGMADVVFSAYALHHLNRPDKGSVLKQVGELLVPGGWFVNADLIIADSPEVEQRLQQIRVAGIVERAGGADNRFADSASTRRFLDHLQVNEGDQPLTLAEDLDLLRSSGLKNVSAFWLEYRELVSGGQRPHS